MYGKTSKITKLIKKISKNHQKIIKKSLYLQFKHRITTKNNIFTIFLLKTYLKIFYYYFIHKLHFYLYFLTVKKPIITIFIKKTNEKIITITTNPLLF